MREVYIKEFRENIIHSLHFDEITSAKTWHEFTTKFWLRFNRNPLYVWRALFGDRMIVDRVHFINSMRDLFPVPDELARLTNAS